MKTQKRLLIGLVLATAFTACHPRDASVLTDEEKAKKTAGKDITLPAKTERVLAAMHIERESELLRYTQIADQLATTGTLSNTNCVSISRIQVSEGREKYAFDYSDKPSCKLNMDGTEILQGGRLLMEVYLFKGQRVLSGFTVQTESQHPSALYNFKLSLSKAGQKNSRRATILERIYLASFRDAPAATFEVSEYSIASKIVFQNAGKVTDADYSYRAMGSIRFAGQADSELNMRSDSLYTIRFKDGGSIPVNIAMAPVDSKFHSEKALECSVNRNGRYAFEYVYNNSSVTRGFMELQGDVVVVEEENKNKKAEDFKMPKCLEQRKGRYNQPLMPWNSLLVI